MYYKWDDFLQVWENFIMEEYDYDTNGNMTYYKSWLWDEISNEWYGSYLNEMFYTVTGKIEQSIIYFWETGTSSWVQYNKQVFEYDIDDYLVLRKNYDWDDFSNAWAYTHKYEYTNNISGNPELLLIYYSINNGSTWTTSNKTEFTYNATDNLILQIFYLWEEDTQEWEFTDKNEFDWDEFGNRILEKRYHWDPILTDWQLMFMTENVYNASSTLLMVAWYYYNEDIGMVVGDFKKSFELNENGKYAVSSEFIWDETTDDWKLNIKGFYHYSLITNIEDNREHNIVVFPNPVTSELAIRLANAGIVKFGIYSLSGTLLLEGSGFRQTNVVNVFHLPDGVYILRIDAGNGVYSRQFIKK